MPQYQPRGRRRPRGAVQPQHGGDLDDGCIGAVIEYVGSRIDLSAFDEMPSQDYIAGCIAPFALSDEVTATIPQETLGAMINCDYDAIQARFEADFAPAPRRIDRRASRARRPKRPIKTTREGAEKERGTREGTVRARGSCLRFAERRAAPIVFRFSSFIRVSRRQNRISLNTLDSLSSTTASSVLAAARIPGARSFSPASSASPRASPVSF